MKFFFAIFLLFPISVLAVDKEIIDSNNQFFTLLERVEVIKNRSESTIKRVQEFSNFANEFSDPGPNWQTLKVSVMDVIIADVNFWAQEITQYPAMQEKLIGEFSLDWYEDSISNYAQKKSLVITELKRKIQKIDMEKKMLKEMITKLESVTPTTLE